MKKALSIVAACCLMIATSAIAQVNVTHGKGNVTVVLFKDKQLVLSADEAKQLKPEDIRDVSISAKGDTIKIGISEDAFVALEKIQKEKKEADAKKKQ